MALVMLIKSWPFRRKAHGLAIAIMLLLLSIDYYISFALGVSPSLIKPIGMILSLVLIVYLGLFAIIELGVVALSIKDKAMPWIELPIVLLTIAAACVTVDHFLNI